MESLLAKALESKLKYWLKSFTRDQFKLKGRTVELCNLDLNGEVLHASIGLPRTLLVSQARVGKLELKVPPFSNVQTEPVEVLVDKLDIVLVEKSVSEPDVQLSTNTSSTSTTATKSTSYGFADKIADGMTFRVGTVNLLLETRGGMKDQGASWTPPLAAITIRNLILYTTNEYWEVVNLKEARDFSNNKKCIYVFKMLEWDSLSVDLLPHPDMFSDEKLTDTKTKKADDDGAKRMFFGGERFLDNISGKAHITMHRTEQNNPLGLEVQVQIPQAMCTALSEPGLRALLRFMTGMYVCMNRADVGSRSSQSGAEAAGRSLVAVLVDHIFLCIKDADFQLEFLLHNLHYMRSTIINGQETKTMARIYMGDLFLRDTFSSLCKNLVQPVKLDRSSELPPIPNFANEKLWPRIYPLSDSISKNDMAPLICMHSLQTIPSPTPPALASQTVVQCQPLKVDLHEEACLRLASFLADGVVVERGVVTPTSSLESVYLTLKQLDIVIPMDDGMFKDIGNDEFKGARLHVQDFIFIQSPSLNLKTLELEKDPACFMLWQGQPVDASQRKWVMRAKHMDVALEMGSYDVSNGLSKRSQSPSLWSCVEMIEPCIEMAMVTGDGDPIVIIPPPGGIVRFGINSKKLTSNTSVEQLFFVLKMYEYLGKVNESVVKVMKSSKKVKAHDSLLRVSSVKSSSSISSLLEMAPSDTAVCLGLEALELRFLESISNHRVVQGPPLVQVSGSEIRLKVTHRTLGGAIAILSKLGWGDALVECIETNNNSGSSFEPTLVQENTMRPVFWISNGKYESICNGHSSNSNKKPQFLDVEVTNVIPYRPEDAECHSLRIITKISGIRLGGGMLYSETLLHRFGVLGPDGGPGEELKRILQNLSNGPLARLLQPPQVIQQDKGGGLENDQQLELSIPDELDVNIQLRDWIFALEADVGATENALTRREKCWHSGFQCLSISAKGNREDVNRQENLIESKHPVQNVIITIEGLEFIKPVSLGGSRTASSTDLVKGIQSGLDFEVLFGVKEDVTSSDMHMGQWTIEKLRSGIKNPIQVEATKQEVEYLVETVRLEIEAASRIAAGLMQLLKLQGSVGQAAIKQLSNIGSGNLDRLITPERTGRRSSIGSIGSGQFCNGNLHQESSIDLHFSELDQAIASSKDICSKLCDKVKTGDSVSSGELSHQLSLLACQLKVMEDVVRKSRSAAI